MSFRVLHNWGSEGWKPIEDRGEIDFETVWRAVEAREKHVRSAGGEQVIVEVIPILTAYRMAADDEAQEASH